MIYDDTNCVLGEGPLWHPLRNELFWFDILARKLHRRGQSWQFDSHVSAAGWVDEDTLIVASGRALLRFDISSGQCEHLADLEADNPATRPNDGRADPQGGFWIGTMGLVAEAGAGAIYRYYRGEVRRLFAGISIPNAICFAPGGEIAYFTDTPTGQVMRQRLGADGWPDGTPEVWLDLTAEGLLPDGAVVDDEGNFWNAQWGANRVACYNAQGEFQRAVEFPAKHSSCPAFGGKDLRDLFCTSASAGLSQGHLAKHPQAGQTFVAENIAKGQREHRVIL